MKFSKEITNKVYSRLDIESIIPAYAFKPCECCTLFTHPNGNGNEHYEAECTCGKVEDAVEAGRWCARMEIADRYQTLLEDQRNEQV